MRDLLIPLISLMDQETDLQAMARYCVIAASDKEKRFADQVRNAVKLLSNDLTVSADGTLADPGDLQAGQQILATAAVYDLKDMIPQVRELMGSKNAGIRNAARLPGQGWAFPGQAGNSTSN